MALASTRSAEKGGKWAAAGPRLESPVVQTPNKGREHWANVPMRWFNSLPFNNAFGLTGDWVFNHNMTGSLFDSGTSDIYDDGLGQYVQPWKVMQGDMIVHFAGPRDVRDSWMGPWLDRVEAKLPEWANATTQAELKRDIQEFWRRRPSSTDVTKSLEIRMKAATTRERNRAEKEAQNKQAVTESQIR